MNINKLPRWFISSLLIIAITISIFPVCAFAAVGPTIYFENTAGWSTVNIYYWSSSNTSMVSWPGSPMVKNEDGIYSFRIPLDATMVIFNNGSTQTADLNLPDGKNLYIYNSGWSVYEDSCDHNWNNGTVTTPATCTEDGIRTFTCSLCGDTAQEVIPAAHSISGGICTICGAKYRTVYFINSGNWTTVNIYYWSSADTSMVGWPGKTMTLVEGNLYSYNLPDEAELVIFNNGSTQTADLELPESDNLYTYNEGWSKYNTCTHSWDDGTVTTEATCTAEGLKTYSCSLCGEAKAETIPATGHSISNGVCTICGAVENCVDHIWDDGTVTQEATCWVAGIRTYCCTACGETKTETISAGHNFYIDQIIEPTCISTGKQITKCTGCRYSADKTLPKVAHTYEAGEVVAPTCTADGYTVGTCAVCQATTQLNPVFHTGHNWSGTDCTACGAHCDHTYVDGICSSCHDGGPSYVQGYYEIANASQLYWFAAQVNSGNNAINGRLIADIDLNNKVWTSIGYYLSDSAAPDTMPYTGIFDGQGHTISNFTTAGTDNEGLFGYCSSATIMNLGIVNAKITGWRAGAVAGYALTSTITGCFAIDCTITGYTTNSVALTSGTVYIAPVASPQGGIVKNCFALNCVLIDDTELEVYTSPVGGTDTQNGYYCNIQWSGEFSSLRNSTAVTSEQLSSGEVTFLLNQGVTDGTQSWYQTCGTGLPAHIGQTVYRITGCTDGVVIYTNDSTADGHHYSNGYCTACGAKNPDYVETVAPTVTLKYPTLAFRDEIQYNLYFNVDNMTDVVEMGLLTFADRNYEGTIDDALDVIPGYIANADSSYTAQSKGVSARLLGDTMFFKVYAKLSDGTYAYSDVVGYHAVAYANTILNNASSSAKAKALVVAMLNYGAAAQTYFGYKTDALINANLTAEQQALVQAYDGSMVEDIVNPDESKTGVFVMSTGYSNIHPTVSFQGAFSINYYFTPKYTPADGVTFYYWTATDYNNADVLTPENATGTIKMTSTTGEYTAAVTGISAKQIDETVYIAAVYNSASTGTAFYTRVIAYSLGNYCETLANNGNEFGAATAVYGYYAKAYFAN